MSDNNSLRQSVRSRANSEDELGRTPIDRCRGENATIRNGSYLTRTTPPRKFRVLFFLALRQIWRCGFRPAFFLERPEFLEMDARRMSLVL